MNALLQFFFAGGPIPIQQRQDGAQCDVRFGQRRIERSGAHRGFLHPRIGIAGRKQSKHGADQQSFRQRGPRSRVVGIGFHRLGKERHAVANAVRRGELPVVTALQVSIAAFFAVRLPPRHDAFSGGSSQIAHQLLRQMVDRRRDPAAGHRRFPTRCRNHPRSAATARAGESRLLGVPCCLRSRSRPYCQDRKPRCRDSSSLRLGAGLRRLTTTTWKQPSLMSTCANRR